MKKRFSILVAMVLLLQTLLPVFSVNAAFTDIGENHPYKKAITTLSTLGIIKGYDDGSFGADNQITRAEFTTMVVRMLGMSGFGTLASEFGDVSPDHWANKSGDIKTAYDMKIINGYDDGTFRPDSPVTYEQALKMMVCTLGYQAFAENMGGYPQGYQLQATSIGLTKSVVNPGYSENATRGIIAQVMYNALEIEKYELENGTYKKSGKTLLNDYIGVKSVKGSIVGVEDAVTSDCDEELSKGKLSVEDSKTSEEYVIDFSDSDMGATVLKSYLGRTVTVFFSQDKTSTDKFLVAIDAESSKNTELTLTSYDIDAVTADEIEYFDKNGKSKDIALDLDNLSIRYNGRSVVDDVELDDEEYTPVEAVMEWLDPDSDFYFYGTARLVDNGSTGKINLIEIFDYETIVAYKRPSSVDYKVTDKTDSSKSLTLDPETTKYKYTILKNGKEVELTDVAANEVINYAWSLDDKYCTAVVTSEFVSGTIKSLKDSADNGYVAIGENEYHTSPDFFDYFQEEYSKELEAGMEIKAYKDVIGALVWGTITSTEEFAQYAYLIDVEWEGDDYYLKMFAPTSLTGKSLAYNTSYDVKAFKIASSAKLNGKKKSAEAITDALADSAETPDADIDGVSVENDSGYNQMIRVTFNAAKEITNVITLSGAEGQENSDESSLVRYCAIDPEGKYNVSASSIKFDGGQYSIKSSTPLFIIPTDRDDSDAYLLKGATMSGAMVAGTSYYVEAYNLSSRYPACLVVYASSLKGGTSITRDSAFALITDDIREDGYDAEDDESYYELPVFTSAGTTAKSRIADSAASTFKTLELGDVIRYSFDASNHVNKHQKIADFDDIMAILDSDTNEYDWTDLDWIDDSDNYSDTGLVKAYARAAMFNVHEVSEEDKLMYLSTKGFDEDGLYDESDYEQIKYSSSTRILRYDEDEKEFTEFVDGETKFSPTDLREAAREGLSCSKVLVIYGPNSASAKKHVPTADMIIVYQW